MPKAKPNAPKAFPQIPADGADSSDRGPLSRTEALCAYMKSLRLGCKVSLAQMGDAMGLDGDTVGRFERGSGYEDAKLFGYVTALKILSNAALIQTQSALSLRRKFLEQTNIQPTSGSAAVAAYKIWLELSTRKLALKLDTKHDLMEEVYDSWFAAFGKIRDVLSKLTDAITNEQDSAKGTVVLGLGMEILNDVMRPHLTRWQGDFRYWLSLKSAPEVYEPMGRQLLETTYPSYRSMVLDMMAANERLVKLRDDLQTIVFGPQDLGKESA